MWSKKKRLFLRPQCKMAVKKRKYCINSETRTNSTSLQENVGMLPLPLSLKCILMIYRTFSFIFKYHFFSISIHFLNMKKRKYWINSETRTNSTSLQENVGMLPLPLSLKCILMIYRTFSFIFKYHFFLDINSCEAWEITIMLRNTLSYILDTKSIKGTLVTEIWMKFLSQIIISIII